MITTEYLNSIKPQFHLCDRLLVDKTQQTVYIFNIRITERKSSLRWSPYNLWHIQMIDYICGVKCIFVVSNSSVSSLKKTASFRRVFSWCKVTNQYLPICLPFVDNERCGYVHTCTYSFYENIIFRFHSLLSAVRFYIEESHGGKALD